MSAATESHPFGCALSDLKSAKKDLAKAINEIIEMSKLPDKETFQVQAIEVLQRVHNAKGAVADALRYLGEVQ